MTREILSGARLFDGTRFIDGHALVIEDGAYSASLDGMTLAGDLVLEIKCPMRGTRSDLWQDVSQGQVPEHYRVQVQHQLMVSGAEQAHLWVFDGAKGILTEVTRDDALMTRIREAWEAFQPFLDRDVPPPLAEGGGAGLRPCLDLRPSVLAHPRGPAMGRDGAAAHRRGHRH